VLLSMMRLVVVVEREVEVETWAGAVAGAG
jgi:hypothetical protein